MTYHVIRERHVTQSGVEVDRQKPTGHESLVGSNLLLSGIFAVFNLPVFIMNR